MADFKSAEIKSESVADFIPESVADLRRNQHKGPKVVTDALPISCFPVPDLAYTASPLSDGQKLQSFDAERPQQWLICH